MAVSLKNRKNTKITMVDGAIKLIHHGHNTCTIYPESGTIEINTCGYDTVTTRGKINLFLDKYAPLTVALIRDRGETFLAYWDRDNNKGWHDRSMRSEFNGKVSVSTYAIAA